jgi:hypothetical protein
VAYDKLKQERDFDFDETNNPGLKFLAQEKPRRFTFLTSFYYAVGGQTMLYSRSMCHPGLIAMFNRVFLENPALLHGFPPTTHLNFYLTNALNALMPWTNLILESIIHEAHDEIAQRNGYNEYAWETLGPILKRKLDFLAAFITDDSGAVLLPEDMEPISAEEEERIREMMPGIPT